MSPDLADIDIAASLVSLVISIELRRISMTCPEHCEFAIMEPRVNQKDLVSLGYGRL